MKYILPLLILSGLLLHSCSDESPEKESDLFPPTVETYLCGTEEYRPELNSYGLITAVRKADILPPSDSIIRRMYFDEGDSVSEGDILAELDLQQIDIQIKEAESTLNKKESSLELSLQKLSESRRNIESRFYSIRSAEIELNKKEAELERMKEILNNKRSLFEMGGITKDELLSIELGFMEKKTLFQQARCSLDIKQIGFREMDLLKEGYLLSADPQQNRINYIDLNTRVIKAETDMARSELEAARSSLESLKLYRDENTIRSPLNGIIVRRFMDEGEKASRDKPIYHICCSDEVYATCLFNEKDLLRLSSGKSATISSPVGAIERSGSVSRISPWIQSDSASAEVLILLDNRDGIFRFGQYVNVSIQLDEALEELVIPVRSILDGSAFLLRKNHIFRKELTTGPLRGGMVPVYGGLLPGDRILLNPQKSFIDGMEVSIR